MQFSHAFRSRNTTISMILLLLLSRPSSASSPAAKSIEESHVDNQAEQEYVAGLEALLSERNKLTSWYYAAKETKREQNREGHVASISVASIESWKFGDYVRFQRIKDGHKTVVVRNHAGWWASTTKSDYLFVDDATAARYIDFFDVRSVGLGLKVEIAHNYSLEELVRAYQGTKFDHTISLIDQSSSVIRIGPYNVKDQSFYELIITNDGTRPLRGSMTVKKEKVEWVNVSWTKKAGVFVPETFEHTHFVMDSRRDWTVEFEWKLVNASLSPDIFDLAEANPNATFMIKDVGDATEADRITKVRMVEVWESRFILTILLAAFAMLASVAYKIVRNR